MPRRRREEMMKTLKRRCAHSSRSPCEHLSLLQQDLFGVSVLVDDDDGVGAHHQGVRVSVFPLQHLEEHMGRVRASQTQQTADQGQCGQARGPLGAVLGPSELQVHRHQSQKHNQTSTQTQKQSHIRSGGPRQSGPVQGRPSITEGRCAGRPSAAAGPAFLCCSFNAKSLTLNVCNAMPSQTR